MPSINIEEVRNVVGGKFSDGSVCYHTSIHDTIMHDVCENGYRLFVSLKLRYGHVDVSCPIDSAIKSWCMARAEKCIQAVKYLGG
jgi:hypothetical protein